MPIHEAAEFDHVEVMRYLLNDPRIDVNAVDRISIFLFSFCFNFKNKKWCFHYNFNRTALHWAADKGNKEIIKLLLSHKGIRTDLRDAISLKNFK